MVGVETGVRCKGAMDVDGCRRNGLRCFLRGEWKRGGGFWALKDFPALLVELAMLASSERCFRHGDVLSG